MRAARLRRLLVVAVLAGPVGAAVPVAAETTVIERILAVVNNRPVLLSETAVIEELRGLERRAALEALIDELLMYAEAARYPHARPTTEEDAAALASLKARAFDRTRLDEADLKRLAHRQATILKYVGLRLRPLVRVSEEQLLEAYRARYAENPSAPPLAAVADDLRGELAARELDARIEEWARQLRATVELRYVDEPPAVPIPAP